MVSTISNGPVKQLCDSRNSAFRRAARGDRLDRLMFAWSCERSIGFRDLDGCVLCDSGPHIYIRPKTPHLNGKVERSHRVDEQEFYQLLDKHGIADDIHLFNDKLREWEDYYN